MHEVHTYSLCVLLPDILVNMSENVYAFTYLYASGPWFKLNIYTSSWSLINSLNECFTNTKGPKSSTAVAAPSVEYRRSCCSYSFILHPD